MKSNNLFKNGELIPRFLNVNRFGLRNRKLEEISQKMDRLTEIQAYLTSKLRRLVEG
jgi:hypothetical protein